MSHSAVNPCLWNLLSSGEPSHHSWTPSKGLCVASIYEHGASPSLGSGVQGGSEPVLRHTEPRSALDEELSVDADEREGKRAACSPKGCNRKTRFSGNSCCLLGDPGGQMQRHEGWCPRRRRGYRGVSRAPCSGSSPGQASSRRALPSGHRPRATRASHGGVQQR